MRNNSKHIASRLFIISLMVMAHSCAPPPDLSHKECTPPPPPECKPGSSNAKGIDTSRLQAGYFKYHIDLLPKPVNSNKNENAIAFLPSEGQLHALISSEEKNAGEMTQRINSSKMLEDLHFAPIVEIESADRIANMGAPVFCKADGLLYFTAKAANDDPNDYDIFCAKLVSKEGKFVLTNVASLDVLNKKISFDAQPAIRQDGLMIVFASDRDGGYGGVDLWYSTRSSVGGTWLEPKVLPTAINSACDELSPSFSADGTKLFFSSDGHETIGGYDIFSAEYSDGAWSKAENIGAPINTVSDEIFPYQLSDSQFFYTSDQPCSFKGRNIFVLRRSYIPPKGVAAKTIPDTVELKGKVEMPAVRDSLLPEVFVRDVAKNKEIARKKTDTIGNYSFHVEKGREYDVGSEVKDKFYDLHRVDLRHPVDSVIVVPALAIPDTLILRLNFPFDDDSHPYDFVIDDQGQKTDMMWKTSIDLIAASIKNSSKSLQSVVLYGHTDSLGTDEYNIALASRRAGFIAKELKARGIPSKLLLIIAKGRTVPVSRKPGESDEIFQLRCRRVEFIKVFKKENSR